MDTFPARDNNHREPRVLRLTDAEPETADQLSDLSAVYLGLFFSQSSGLSSLTAALRMLLASSAVIIPSKLLMEMFMGLNLQQGLTFTLLLR